MTSTDGCQAIARPAADHIESSKQEQCGQILAKVSAPVICNGVATSTRPIEAVEARLAHGADRRSCASAVVHNSAKWGLLARQARVTAPVNAIFRRRGVRAIAVGVGRGMKSGPCTMPEMLMMSHATCSRACVGVISRLITCSVKNRLRLLQPH